MNRDVVRVGAGVLAATAFLVVAATAMYATVTVLRKEPAHLRGSPVHTERVYPGNRIAAYDNFFILCSAIQAKEGTLTTLKDELATNPAPERARQIRAFITTVTTSRRSDIDTYNANARRSGTRAQFRSSALPYAIDPNQEHTACIIR